MVIANFYHSNTPEYFWQKWHYNYGNQVVHSTWYKKLNPLRARYEYTPNDYSQLPWYLGQVPQLSWLYGNLDYSFFKYHRLYQAHDDWYPDRKNKSLGHKNGGFMDPTRRASKYMVMKPGFIPRGCYREIRKYKMCTEKNQGNKEACFSDKLSIMEVCPEHVLEGLREKKKWHLRAELLDNDTYKRAMEVSSYNKGRSVSDLQLKTWSYGTAQNLKTDSLWSDDRYNPSVYSHPHRYDSINFPDQEYQDIFGGTMGEGQKKEQAFYKPGLFGGNSQAANDFLQNKSEKEDAPKAGH